MRKTSGIILGLVFGFLMVTKIVATEMDWTKPVLIGQPEMKQLPSGISKMKLRGSMTIRVEIDEFGHVTGSTMVTSSNSDILDGFIQRWIKDWEYLPRLKDDQPAAGFSMVVIHFDLMNQSFQVPAPITDAIQIPDSLAEVLVQAGQDNPDDPRSETFPAPDQEMTTSGDMNTEDSDRIASDKQSETGARNQPIGRGPDRMTGSLIIR